MKIFFENYSDSLSVDFELPLESTLEQAIEIFHNLPDYDGSYIGFINKDGNVIHISKYDRFLFYVEISSINNEQDIHNTLYTYHQVMRFIKKLYKEFNPHSIRD